MRAHDVVRGIGAAVTLVAVIVGVPVLLLAVGTWPFSSGFPSWGEITTTLSRPDYDGTVLLGILSVVTWVAWLVFTIAILIEVPSQLRGRAARGVPGVRRLVGPLVAAALSLIPLAATAPALAAPAQPQSALAGAADSAAAGPVTSDAPASSVGPFAASPTTEGPTYTVRSGDSLWRIAENALGDGGRFQEIADLNYGAPQPDGATLDSSHWLRPGWILTLPAGSVGDEPTSPPSDPDASEPVTHVVRPGESLSSIARDALGDPDRYPEILAATRGILQPDGSVLTNPDLIQPGWTVALPGVDNTAVVPTPSPAEPAAPPPAEPTSPPPVEPAPAELAAQDPDPDQEQAAPPVPPPGPTPGEQDATEYGAATMDESDASDVAPAVEMDLRTASGIGGLLAAGIVGLVTMRRIQARRDRRPGERPTLPDAGTKETALESSVRAVADPMGREIVDRALRALAAHHRRIGSELPPLRAARLVPGRYVELFLDNSCDLPEPWTPSPDRTLWRLDTCDLVDLPDVEDTESAAAYPTLVTIGQDHEAHLMVDLERLGCLDVRGNIEDGRAVLAGLAIELGTSTWADDLQVTVVGALAELPGVLDTGRLRHVVSLSAVMRELEARALDVEAALRQVGAATIAEARSSGALADAWTPEILLIGEQLGPMVRGALERLVAKVPGTGVAAVTTGSDHSQWAIEIDPDAPERGILHPAGVSVRPQRLDAAEYVQALSLLRFTENSPGPSWARNLTGMREPQLIEIPVSVSMGLGSTEPQNVEVDRLVEAVPPREAVSPLDDATVPSPGDAMARIAGEDVPVPAVLPPPVVGPADIDSDPLGIGPLDLGPLEPLEYVGYDTGHSAAAIDPVENSPGSEGPVSSGVDDDETAIRPLLALPVPEVSESDTPPADETVPRSAVAAAVVTTGAASTDEAAPAAVHSLRTPVVRVLGSVVIDVASGITMPASHQRQATELIAYLAFHPGATGSDISAAMWPTRDPNLATRRSAVSRARRWLGVDSSGHEYLPRYWARDNGTPADQESAGYRLLGVGTDWDEFLRLVGDDVTATPMARLVEALALVRGPAFAGIPARKYVWAEHLWQEITTGIVDVAHEVARRALLAGEMTAARDAARVGRLVDPADERSWRNGIRAEWADGRAHHVARLVAQLRDHLGALDLDADQDTEDLINEVEGYLAQGGERGA